MPRFDEWLCILSKAWDATDQCFRCQISGITLCIDNRSSPAYATLEHGENGDFMVVAAVINDMKSDLTLEEFKKIAANLCAYWSGNMHAPAETLSLFNELKRWHR